MCSFTVCVQVQLMGILGIVGVPYPPNVETVINVAKLSNLNLVPCTICLQVLRRDRELACALQELLMLDCASAQSPTDYYNTVYSMVVLPFLLLAFLGVVYGLLFTFGKTIGKRGFAPRSSILNDPVVQQEICVDVALGLIHVRCAAFGCLRMEVVGIHPLLCSWLTLRLCKAPSACSHVGSLRTAPVRCDKLRIWIVTPLKPQMPALLLISPSSFGAAVSHSSSLISSTRRLANTHSHLCQLATGPA